MRGWKKLTWWQRTRYLVAAFCLIALSITLALCFILASGSGSRETLSWMTFSLFPLAAVCLIAVLAQVQSSLNDTRGALSNYSDPDSAQIIDTKNASGR